MFASLLHWKRKVTKRIGEPALVKQLTRDFSPGRFLLKSVLLFLAFSAGVVAIASLRKPVPDTTVLRKGIDVIIALDVSKSMLATDLVPSRLERAKQTINKLIGRPGLFANAFDNRSCGCKIVCKCCQPRPDPYAGNRTYTGAGYGQPCLQQPGGTI
jgi:hypothetical protein